MKDPLTGAVIGAAIRVHREIGPGLLESVYEQCLCVELDVRGIAYRRGVSLPMVYAGFPIPAQFRLDLVVESSLIVELKSVQSLHPVHASQLLTYLRLSGLSKGLLINFNVVRLVEGITRLVR